MTRDHFVLPILPLASGARRDVVLSDEARQLATLDENLRAILRTSRPGDPTLGRSRAAMDWLERTDRSDPLGFERICQAFGIDAGVLRRRVLEACGRRREWSLENASDACRCTGARRASPALGRRTVSSRA